MGDTRNGNGSWTTVKTIIAIIPLGAAVAGIALYIGSGPTREEFERLKTEVTEVKMEQIRIRSEVEMINRSQQRVEAKLDKAIESDRGQP